ncbi:MAG: hypothetical protein M0Z31_14755 [Clostridia bacterium]|nr:hypothetical protein [Clostridia bacterium]
MSDVFVDLRKAAGQDRASRLMQIIPQIGSVDILNITVERLDAHETDEILEVLVENGFEYQPKGGEEAYNIVARRIH